MTENTSESIIACCGLICSECGAYKKQKCLGCYSDKPMYKNCPVKKCVIEQNYVTCADCTEYSSLMIALSHSGNTEETLSATRSAIERGCRLLAITTGGSLAPFAIEAGGTAWIYEYNSPPRAALGWLYGQVLAALSRLHIAPDLSGDVDEAVGLLRRSQPKYGPEISTTRNVAKRIGGQLVEIFRREL